MSYVTTVLVSTPVLDDLDLSAIDVPGPDGARPTGRLVRMDTVDEAWGGSKPPQVTLWGGGFNYMDIPAFLKTLRGLPWKFPDELQIFVKDENDHTFSVYKYREGESPR